MAEDKWAKAMREISAEAEREEAEHSALSESLREDAMARVTVTISGPTGSGKSRLGHEIAIALKAIGVKVEWSDPTGEREAELEAWAEARAAYQPDLPEVVLQEINTPITIAEGFRRLEIETKHYSDGTTATGVAPLPDLSPDQQDAHDHPQYCCGDVMECQSDGYAYLVKLLRACAPQCTPLPDMLGLCTQIDNLIAGYRIRLGELPDPARNP